MEHSLQIALLAKTKNLQDCTASIKHVISLILSIAYVPPRHPQTKGMVERFNGWISELLKQTQINSADELEKTLNNHLVIYNHHIPQQAIQQWQENSPALFVKKDFNHAGLNN